MIRPNEREQIMLPAGENHVFALPKEYQSANVPVEIFGGGLTKAEAVCASLSISVLDGTTVAEVQLPKRQADREP